MRFELLCGCRPTPIFKAARRDELVDRDRPEIRRLTSRMRRVVRAFLREQAASIAQQVAITRTMLGKAAGDDADRILGALHLEQWQALAGALFPLFADMVQAGARAAAAQSKLVDDIDRLLMLTNDNAIDYARTRSAELVSEIAESTRRMIRANIVQALQDGLSNDELAALLQRGYAFSRERSEMIARTETAFADVEGNLLAYEQSGVVASKKWITGAGCCDLCDELNGKVVPLKANFPGGRKGPPLHPNCRCDIVPILKEKDDA